MKVGAQAGDGLKVKMLLLLLPWDAILQCEKDGSYRGIGKGREARIIRKGRDECQLLFK